MVGKIGSPLQSHDSPWQEFVPSERLNDLRDFVEAGVPPAIHDTWSLVIAFDLQVPDWLAAPTKALIATNLRHARVHYRRRMKHYYRWRTVKRIRAAETKYQDVFVEAAERLLGTQYYASPATIKDSYDEVERGLRDPNDPKTKLQYYTAMSETREIMGTAFAVRKR